MFISDSLLQRIKRIRLLILDVDGVMTDGALVIGDDGQEYKRFFAQDGLGLTMLRSTGVEIAIITGRTSNVVKKRAEEIGVNHLYQGKRNKYEAYLELLAATGLNPEQTAFMGDDIIDLPVMTQVGLSLSVPEGHALARQHAHWLSERAGGYGAVRDACELIMTAQGTLDDQVNRFLSLSSASDVGSVGSLSQ